jgi:CDP-diacylglycerol---glycerol-3-phosphate 3-phosphatidyltransferase
VTAFGKLADPLADKALVLAALGFLAVHGETPWWPVVIITVRELGVTLGRLAVARDVVIPASFGGKAKTALQVGAIFFLLLPSEAAWADALGWWLLLTSVVAAVVTGIDYGWRIFGVARRHGATSSSAASEAADSVDPSGHVG